MQHYHRFLVPSVTLRVRIQDGGYFVEHQRHEFFVVRDDIVIVDRSHKIVAIVATGDQVGTTGAASGTQMGGAPAAGFPSSHC